MKFNYPRDDQLIDIMLQGGQKFCNEAMRKWGNRDYYNVSDKELELNIARWHYASYRCWQLMNYLRGELDGAPKRFDYDA